jgi:hypothetical protein
VGLFGLRRQEKSALHQTEELVVGPGFAHFFQQEFQQKTAREDGKRRRQEKTAREDGKRRRQEKTSQVAGTI